MTTARQIKELVAPLLARHSELGLIDTKAMAILPIRHLIHIITIDRTGEAARCRPMWGVSALMNDLAYLPVGFGERILRRGTTGLWEWADPSLSDALIRGVEEQALPRLRSIHGLPEYCSMLFSSDLPRRKFYGGYVACLLVLGELDEARSFLSSYEPAEAYWAPRLRELGVRDALMEDGNRLAPEHRGKITGFFHAAEARSVERLKLGAFWELAPFPIEQSA